MERFPLFLLLVLGIAIGCSEKDDTGSSSGTTDIPADADADADGYDATDDCDDGDATVHPGADEVAYDGVDNDCDPSTADDDLDGDGFLSSVDCDDDDPDLHPGVDELCNDVDDDCDGSVDEDPVDGETFYADDDADGYGDPHDGQEACERPDGWLADSNDCDDADATVHPDAEEVCDGVDNDCNGVVDDGDGDTWYADTDGDGYGDITAALLACTQPSGHVADDTDCDDGDGAVHPGAEEVCNGVDDDCDGEADGSAATDVSAWYADTDGDGYGDPAVSQDACDQPTGYVDDDTDCDDTDARAFPGGTELPYDGVDGDCDGASDYDVDADGYDSDAYGGDDCDDDDPAVNPGAGESWYDGVDGDCDGASDFDADGDGYDNDAHTGTDCDDGDGTVYPGASETDPAVDQDCDGEVEAAPTASADYVPFSSLEHCSELILDGSGSVDPDGFPVSFEWTVDSVPGASGLTTEDLDDPTAEQPTCYPDTPGVYVFGLTVTDFGGLSDSASVSVTVTTRATNTAPVADAGSDVTVTTTVTCTEGSGYEYTCDDCVYEGSPVDASVSTDVDGEPLSYGWTVASGTGSFDDDTLATPALTLTGSEAEYGSTITDVYLLEVDVTDCYGYADTASVWVSVECTGE